MVIESEAAALPQLLDACTVNVLVPAVLGVPVIAPLVEFSDNPAGIEPAVTVQLRGAVPVAVVICE
jgi:hypothetical protein